MKNIKLIIFDLDGTFYDLNDVIAGVYDCQVKFLSNERNISEDVARAIFTENCIFPYASAESKSCTEYFARIGIDKARWTAFRESNFDVTRINLATAVDSAVISQFASHYKIYLLSSNTRKTIERILSHLKIDSHLFADIISSDHFVSSNPFNKREAMDAIIQKSAFAPDKCLSIGDRYSTDILPMLELSGNGTLVKTSRALSMIVKGLYSNYIRSCEDYVCYEPDAVNCSTCDKEMEILFQFKKRENREEV